MPKLRVRSFDLSLKHPWTIASRLNQGAKTTYSTLFLEIEEGGIIGRGEAAPSTRYGETVSSLLLQFDKIQQRIEHYSVKELFVYSSLLTPAARTTLEIACLDWLAQTADQPLYEFLDLAFRPNQYVTSFSIGLDNPDIVKEKAFLASDYPILKLKVGGPEDGAVLQAVREAAPQKPIRLDANEAWKTKEEALHQIEGFAADGNVQFVEQPMPTSLPLADWKWLKERSPLPVFGDESFVNHRDLDFCSQAFHGVIVKLVKIGGILNAAKALRAARQAGLKTMLGCMIESSLQITAAAHLADLADFHDLDGNLLISNDPYTGITAEKGVLQLPLPPFSGLGVRPVG